MLTQIKPPRASVLFRFHSVFLVGELVSNPLGGFLLGISPWLSLVVGNACMLLAFSGFYFLPETLVVRRWHDARTGRLGTLGRAGLEKDRSNKDEARSEGISRAVRVARAALAQLREIWNFLVTNKQVAFLILPFVFVSLGKYIQELLLQYATKRYGWSWSQVRFLTVHHLSLSSTTC